MTRQEINEQIQLNQDIIRDREARLAAKDYIGVKIAMGVSGKSDYADEIAQTEVWRREINSAQAEIERLSALEPEEELSEPE